MYLARFSYEFLLANRRRAIDFIRREVEAALAATALNAKLLVPLTRGRGDAAGLIFEVELTSLDQLDQFRSRGIGSREETGDWMHAFSEVLTAPPCVEILHVDDGKAGSGSRRRLRSGRDARGPDQIPSARPLALKDGEGIPARLIGDWSKPGRFAFVQRH